MHSSRRALLRAALPSSMLAVAVAAGVLRPRHAFAGDRVTAVLRDLRGAHAELSPAIAIRAPDIAEDGASVFVSCQCDLPGVDALVFFVDRNPQPLVAAFHLAPEVEPNLGMRLKVAQSANVWVVARSGGRFYKASKAVKVTSGGCGLGVN